MLYAERGVAPLSAWGVRKSFISRVHRRWIAKESLKFRGSFMEKRWRFVDSYGRYAEDTIDGHGKYDDEDKGKVKKKQMEAIQSHLRPLGLSSRWENELVCVGRVNQTLFTWWSCDSFSISGDESMPVNTVLRPSPTTSTFLGPMGGQMGASV